MINDKIVKELQSKYLENRTDSNFENLRTAVQGIAKSLIMLKLKGKDVYLDVEEKSYDASVRFMMMYLKHDTWSCQAFAFRIDCEVKYILYNKKQQKIDKELEIPETAFYTEVTPKETTDNVIEDLMEDCEYWRNILMDCYKSTSFKIFIMKCSKYVNRQFIEEHFDRLKDLYKNTRRNKK